jgi:uncharacterized protein (TIGR03437 family)
MMSNRPSTAQHSPPRANAVARGSSTPQWTLIGPQPTTYTGFYTLPAPGYLTSGRVTALAVVPGNASVVYLGGSDGGVWKTTDGGSTWIPLTDDQPSLSIGSIALDPSNSNTIYVGTGEEYGIIENASYYGAGVLKSTDGGATWTQLGASLFGTPYASCGTCGGAFIGSIAVHPTQGQILLAAVAQGGSATGIDRSADGGVTWVPVLSIGIEGTEVLFDPTNGNIAFAALGGGNDTANGLYKSTDAGLTWARPDAAGSNQLPTAGVGRIVLAMAPSNTSTLYAGIADSSTWGLTGFYKSVDGGTNWTQLPSAPNYCGGQCPITNTVAVSPTNANAVFVGGNTDVVGGIASGTAVIWRSLDGGSTWDIVSNGYSGAVHIDQKAFAFSSDGAMLYVGNDGGVWSTTGVAASTLNWTNLNSSLALTQFYPGLSIDPSNVNISFGGTQDNGIQQYAGGVWQSVTCGDGGQTVIDPVQPSTVYASCGNQIQKSTSGGGPNSWSAADTGVFTADRATIICPPLAIDPSNHLNLYFGTYRVYKSSNGAGSWSPVSSDLTFGNGTLSTIAVAPSDSNTVYIGTSNGIVQVTTNAGAGASAAWTDRTPGLPSRSVTQIAVNSLNPLVAFVTLSGFSGFGDTQGHVFQTVNGGASWSDISGNLPNSPADGIVIDPDQSNTLYVATDIGVFATVDGGTTWDPPGSGLPGGAVTALALHRSTRILRAATHGRSVWDLQLAAPAPPAITAAPSSLQLAYTIGGAAPASQSIQIGDGGGGTLAWSASSNAAWLTVTPASGTAPSTLSVSVNPANLSAGSYSATVQITAPGASGSPASVGVTLVVQALATPFTVALSAAGQVEPFAPQSIVSAYGTNLATGTAAAMALPLPTTLADTTVTVTDSAGVARLAPLFYVSPTQVNFEIPAGAASGSATVTIANQNGATQSASIEIGNTSPGLFELDSSGLVAAWVLPVTSGVQGALQPVYQVVSNSVAPLAINLGPSAQQSYLEMYGTGVRNANSVTAMVGGLSVPVLFSGAAPGYPGEDQVNIGPLPRALEGQGSVRIVVTADGQAANTVNVTIQ